MDEHLATHDWFVGNGITLADIALYAYTHVAEGRLWPGDYPHVQAWLARVAAAALCADGLTRAESLAQATFRAYEGGASRSVKGRHFCFRPRFGPPFRPPEREFRFGDDP
jgi:hypothetical protein